MFKVIFLFVFNIYFSSFLLASEYLGESKIEISCEAASSQPEVDEGSAVSYLSVDYDGCADVLFSHIEKLFNRSNIDGLESLREN